jgi:hypothetical protein
MPFNFLVSSLLFILTTSAVASDDTGDAPEPPPTATEEIIVHGDMEIARKRARVIQNLKHLGYEEAARRNGRSIYRPKVPYKPTVVVDDDAWMHVKRSPIRVDPPGRKDNALRYLWCIPPFTITAACVQVGGQVIGRRKLEGMKEEVARATSYEMSQWRTAVIALAMDKRIGEEIPDMLDRVWELGQTDTLDDPVLDEHSARRQVILNFWASRSCIPEGEEVRVLTADFITEIIQTSEHPATQSELDSANQRQRCPESRQLHGTSVSAP